MAKALARDFRRPPGFSSSTGAPVLSMELDRRRAWERGRAIASRLLLEMDKRYLDGAKKKKRKPK